MAYNTKPIIKDKDGNPISQYYNPDTDSYEPVEGSHGANKVLVENNDLSLIPILDKLSQLTGTVIDEETRKSNELERIDNEDTRQFNENIRNTNEIARVEDEEIRIQNENTRIQDENERKTAENIRKTNEDERKTAENTRISNENIRIENENIRVSNEDLRITLYNTVKDAYESGAFKGDKGDTGNGLEFKWDGTSLGVRVKGDTEYIYVDLKGEKGDPGTIENLTSQHIEDALGYTPANDEDVVTLQDEVNTNKLENISQYEELKYSELSSTATNIDDEGIYQNIEWKRKDNTLYAKSTLIGIYPYPQIKIDYYDETGTTIVKTITWDLTYDNNDFPYTRTVI